MNRDNRFILIAILALLCLVTVGVYSSGFDWSGPRLYRVSGKLTINGQPAPGITVLFYPLEGKADLSSAPVDDNGDFELVYGLDGKRGAPAGKYKVVLMQLRASNLPPYGGADAIRVPDMPAATFPPEWQAAGTSKLEVEVRKQANVINVPVEMPGVSAAPAAEVESRTLQR